MIFHMVLRFAIISPRSASDVVMHEDTVFFHVSQSRKMDTYLAVSRLPAIFGGHGVLIISVCALCDCEHIHMLVSVTRVKCS